MKSANPNQLDPLFVIFEQHLLNFQDADTDRKSFVKKVVQDYLNYLRKNQIAIPLLLEPYIVDEISEQVNKMLVKKIYGCLTIDEYQRAQPATKKRQAKAQYRRIQSSKTK